MSVCGKWQRAMPSAKSERVRVAVNAREAAMEWAMQTARCGEDAVTILARAQLYEEWVMEPLGTQYWLSSVALD